MKVTARIKTKATFEREMSDLPTISQEAIMQYGFQRWVNDRVNSAKDLDTPEALEAFAEEVLTRLDTGDLGKQAQARDPRKVIVIDWVSRDLKMTKKSVREAIATQGLERFVAIYGEEAIDTEIERQKVAQPALDADLGASLEALLAEQE